ncbi:FAD-dependent monooxygenase [Xanthobacter dioxanivorans]|uniref:FAD-dependent monooxygenase n=1 Tax=Xanthobacter dioxanivorans TaxID=2528964 RepID=A0A974SGK2_9HYPH|nr:FAD binding domain-containing protein [Xanthobacter dioxanivorans]QRG05351.1 FAD-dependent monooxygenase [Xanthobacter dioxanivorans]
MAKNPGAGQKRALVIGGSMAGLFAALLLRKAGWQAEIFERIGSELAGRGAGIVTHQELLEIMQKCGVDSAAARVGVPVHGRRVFSRGGELVAEMPLEQIVTSWGHLHGLLRRALPDTHFHHGRALVRVEERGERVAAHFADGSVEEGDLLVGADGIFSTVRAQFAPQVTPSYVGYIAWRGLVDEAALSDKTRADLCDHFPFSLPPGEQMLGYPVAGLGEVMERGRRRFNFVWYRPAAAAGVLQDLLTDRDGVQHSLSIPPDRIRPEVVARMRADAAATLAPQFAEVVERTPQPFIQVIQDLASPHMVLGRRTVILGDAAFVARPHVGMGVTKAAGDAEMLVEALGRHGSDMDAALAEFEAERVAFGAAVVRRAQQLGLYIEPRELTQEERAHAEYHRQPSAIMAETAVATGIAA